MCMCMGTVRVRMRKCLCVYVNVYVYIHMYMCKRVLLLLPVPAIRIGYRGIQQYKSGDSRGIFLITGGKSGEMFKTMKNTISCFNVRNAIHELNCTQLKRVNKEVRSHGVWLRRVESSRTPSISDSEFFCLRFNRE